MIIIQNSAVGRNNAVNSHWTGPLKLTTGTTCFGIENIPFTCETASSARSITHSIIYLTAQNQTYFKQGKQEMKIMLVLLLQEKTACMCPFVQKF